SATRLRAHRVLRGGVHRPVGEWNQTDCICRGNSIEVIVNGTLVNRAANVHPLNGRILQRCEGSEIYFRRVELQPLPRNAE
ncbi:MAG: DUF1080 domain-containing protein, partial [Planctomycetales bacterium]|nr:DUF1080 domain-containing protein [Planctomycetales bacterium]